MQDLSYISANQRFSLGDFRFEIAIYTLKNTYTLSPEHTQVKINDDTLTADCSMLCWAGGQELEPGSAHVEATLIPTGIRVTANARMGQAKEIIRSVKLSVFGLKRAPIVNLIDARPKQIPDEGIILRYPEGWRDVGTPLLIMDQGDRLCYLRSHDPQIRGKTFAFLTEGEDIMTAEMIFEELATRFSSRISVPAWEIGYGKTKDEIYAPHIAHLEKHHDLPKWDTRPDVPDWAREISLVAAIHGQHFTGHIFNDYDKILRIIEQLCQKIEGKRILVYIPGWEGRYYWQYGDYRPDTRMGGPEGFKRLCDGAKKLGVHVMPMFGMNVVGKNMDNYCSWGATSMVSSPSGNRSGGSVDWDGSRHYDHASMAATHPGAPQWQNRLVDQIHELMDEYGFDAVFLDIAARWTNDPNYPYYDGMKELARRIRQGYPNMLLSGEAWYDGLMSEFPLIQCGHTDGKMHYHDEAYEPMVAPYVRAFGHLCLGDPATLSTGVHEQGRNPEWYCPYRRGVIPTITIAEDPLENAPERVDQIIDAAKRYAEEFCL